MLKELCRLIRQQREIDRAIMLARLDAVVTGMNERMKDILPEGMRFELTRTHDPATCTDRCCEPDYAGAWKAVWPFIAPLFRDESVPGNPDCVFCRGEGDCLECDPETQWK